MLKKIVNESLKTRSVTVQSLRHGHRMRGKPPGVARSITDRIAELNPRDPELEFKINIGYPRLREPRSEQLKNRLDFLKKNRSNLEKSAREQTLLIDLDRVQDDWNSSAGPFHRKRIAEHYGVFQHLFGDAFFIPRLHLDIKFEYEDNLIPVYYGNVVKPTEARSEPKVSFDADVNLITGAKETESKETFWTLILTNPDGHLTKPNSEYVHWFIGNIRNGDFSSGETIVPYLQPIPPKGTGFHRHIFVLYRQETKSNFSDLKITGNNLNDRTFSTLDFYRIHQQNLTPAGLAFFQSDWDPTLTDVYHHQLKMNEPIYEYDFPKPYIKDQKWFPLRQPFNLYMDKYRDPKQIAKEFLERKLKDTHPFDGPKPALQFPNAQPIRGVPSWLRTEMKKSRLKWGRINEFL